MLEVAGTIASVTNSFTKPIPTLVMALCYLGAISFDVVVKALPIAVVYATWSGLGVFSVAILGYFIFGQDLPWPVIIGLFLIVSGVVLVNSFWSQNVN